MPASHLTWLWSLRFQLIPVGVRFRQRRLRAASCNAFARPELRRRGIRGLFRFRCRSHSGNGVEAWKARFRGSCWSAGGLLRRRPRRLDAVVLSGIAEALSSCSPRAALRTSRPVEPSRARRRVTVDVARFGRFRIGFRRPSSAARLRSFLVLPPPKIETRSWPASPVRLADLPGHRRVAGVPALGLLVGEFGLVLRLQVGLLVPFEQAMLVRPGSARRSPSAARPTAPCFRSPLLRRRSASRSGCPASATRHCSSCSAAACDTRSRWCLTYGLSMTSV